MGNYSIIALALAACSLNVTGGEGILVPMCEALASEESAAHLRAVLPATHSR